MYYRKDFMVMIGSKSGKQRWTNKDSLAVILMGYFYKVRLSQLRNRLVGKRKSSALVHRSSGVPILGSSNCFLANTLLGALFELVVRCASIRRHSFRLVCPIDRQHCLSS